jgi:hypothetical protein
VRPALASLALLALAVPAIVNPTLDRPSNELSQFRSSIERRYWSVVARAAPRSVAAPGLSAPMAPTSGRVRSTASPSSRPTAARSSGWEKSRARCPVRTVSMMRPTPFGHTWPIRRCQSLTSS